MFTHIIKPVKYRPTVANLDEPKNIPVNFSDASRKMVDSKFSEVYQNILRTVKFWVVGLSPGLICRDQNSIWKLKLVPLFLSKKSRLILSRN